MRKARCRIFARRNGGGRRRYLSDRRLEVSDNRPERSIRSFVIDRKNFFLPIRPGEPSAAP